MNEYVTIRIKKETLQIVGIGCMMIIGIVMDVIWGIS